MIESGNINPALKSSISVMKRTCGIVRLVPGYQAAVLSYQLVLKLAEILDAKLRKEVMISSLCAATALLWSFNSSLLCFLVSRRWVRDLEAETPGGAKRRAGVYQWVERWTAAETPSNTSEITLLPKGNWGKQINGMQSFLFTTGCHLYFGHIYFQKEEFFVLEQDEPHLLNHAVKPRLMYYNVSVNKKCCEWSDVGCAAEGRMLPGRRFNPLEAEPDKRPEEEDFRGQWWFIC